LEKYLTYNGRINPLVYPKNNTVVTNQSSQDKLDSYHNAEFTQSNHLNEEFSQEQHINNVISDRNIPRKVAEDHVPITNHEHYGLNQEEIDAEELLNNYQFRGIASTTNEVIPLIDHDKIATGNGVKKTHELVEEPVAIKISNKFVRQPETSNKSERIMPPSAPYVVPVELNINEGHVNREANFDHGINPIQKFQTRNLPQLQLSQSEGGRNLESTPQAQRSTASAYWPFNQRHIVNASKSLDLAYEQNNMEQEKENIFNFPKENDYFDIELKSVHQNGVALDIYIRYLFIK